MQRLIDQIRMEIRHSDDKTDVAKIITDVLVREGVDLRREPSLEDMKQIMVGVCRATPEFLCVV